MRALLWTAAGWLTTFGAAGGAAAAGGPARVLDVQGRLLHRTRYVWIARGRTAVPASAYQRLGLYVQADRRRREVDVAIPDSDVGASFRAGARGFRTHPDGPFTLEPRRFRYPVAVLRRGEFYLPPAAVRWVLPEIVLAR